MGIVFYSPGFWALPVIRRATWNPSFWQNYSLAMTALPFAKALIESGLGEDLEPASGIETDLRYILFTAGMRGVKKNKEEEIEALILETIEKLIRDGIPQDEIEAALMSVDFADREIKRVNGPFSIVLMRRCLRGWLNESHPAKTLQNRSTFAAIKKEFMKMIAILQNF